MGDEPNLDLVWVSFPNSIWERNCGGNSIAAAGAKDVGWM